MFFNSWALWEKMTFVLALAILGVFAIGYGKLVWRNSYVKRQGLVDEEKRAKILELRSNGHTVQATKNSHDVPFGIRAIQSGIQVDGIWISQPTTPVPSEINLGRTHSGSSKRVASSISGKSEEYISDHTLQADPMRSKTQAPLSRRQSLVYPLSEQTSAEGDLTIKCESSAGPRLPHAPRRSSLLHSRTFGDYDEETLDHLEGKQSSPKRIPVSRPLRSSRPIDTDADTFAADNEQTSGTSDESDATLSYSRRSRPDGQRQSLLHLSTTRDNEPSTSRGDSGSTNWELGSKQRSNAEYVSVPNDFTTEELDDHMTNSPHNRLQATYHHRLPPGLTGDNWPDDSPSVSSSHTSPSPFVQGELHVNKTIRKVNSGFEVLPAGTFGRPLEVKDHEYQLEAVGDLGGRRDSSKLQKRPRISASRRPSLTIPHRP